MGFVLLSILPRGSGDRKISFIALITLLINWNGIADEETDEGETTDGWEEEEEKEPEALYFHFNYPVYVLSVVSGPVY